MRIKNFFARLWKYKWWHLGIILILLFLFCIGQQPYQKISYEEIRILFPNDSLDFSYSDLSKHNANLISTLQERESWNMSSISSDKTVILQFQGIYIGVISILLVLAVRTIRNRKNTLISMLVIILVFFLLDIHLEDLLERNIESYRLTGKSLNILINQKPNNPVWYELKYDSTDFLPNDSLYNKLREVRYNKIKEDRHVRKIHSVFDLHNPVQDIFYRGPLILIYIWLAVGFGFRKFGESKGIRKLRLKRISSSRK